MSFISCKEGENNVGNLKWCMNTKLSITKLYTIFFSQSNKIKLFVDVYYVGSTVVSINGVKSTKDLCDRTHSPAKHFLNIEYADLGSEA